MELFDQVGNIELKVRQLVKRSKRLSSENQALVTENKMLKEALHETQANQLIFIEKILHIRERIEEGGIGGDTNQVDLYLKEIQRCIAWLEEQQTSGI